MQKITAKNRKFLENYNDVLRHHIECILKSGLILDEDMNLLMTFWDPSLIPSAQTTSQHFVLTSTTFATAGLLTSFKFQSAYPVTISLMPAVLHFVSRALYSYRERTFKNNFTNLLKVLGEIYRLNKEILLYYSKRDLAVQNKKLQLEAYNLLLKPGENFLKLSTMELMKIIEKIKNNMSQVCEHVPISEGQFICSLEWSVYNFDSFSGDGFHETKSHFEKLTDVYLLITSNFLGCLGLSMCVQLWKEPCDFQSVFTQLIPILTQFLRKSYDNMYNQFGNIRFNMSDQTTFLQKSECSVAVSSRFSKPLQEFLLHLQNSFDRGRNLQLLMEDQRTNADYEQFINILEEAWKNLEISRDCLRVLTHRIEVIVSKSSAKSDGGVMISLPVSTQSVDVVEATTCENLPELKDEEYNLSVHGSEDDCLNEFEDFDDLSAHEDFSFLLLELKKKLQDRQVKVLDESPTKVVPEKIPVVNHSRDINSLLKSVMLTAQKLTRSEEFQFGFNMFPDIPRPFNTTYRCYSVAMLPGNERQDVERGGKIIMPPSALEQLTRLNINYPMQFKIVNKNTTRTSHCGVLEFVADEGKVYLPLWMMQNLVLEEGDCIQIESVSLPVGTFAKFQPLSPEFLDITNPKAVLENCLRTFSCLTSGDVIAVRYNQRVYELCVLETQPGNAISIIECDMNVEFAAPVGYKECEDVKPIEEGMSVDPTELMPEPAGFVAFRGQGNRLDGKRRKDSSSAESVPIRPVYVRGIPDYDYQIGTLRFLRQTTASCTENKEEVGVFKAFSGEGFSLKRRN